MLKSVEYLEPPVSPLPVRPGPVGLWTEWRIGSELLRLGLASNQLRSLPRGDGSTIILVPGWKAPEVTMSPLRLYLKWLGYDARHWGLGTNQGNAEVDSQRMIPIISKLASHMSRPVTLIGWSLGGVIAREIARLHPEIIAQIITYGTPVVGGPTYTLGGPVWGRRECERIAKLIQEFDDQAPIQVPITAIFSRKDAIVSWPACIDRRSANVRHFEVSSTHGGMGLDPAVWAVIARQLAREVKLKAVRKVS